MRAAAGLPDDVAVWNPAFDVTPAALVTAIVCDAGVLRPPFEASIAGALEATARGVKAAVLHAPGDLRVEAVPEPAPGPGEVVLEIGAALSCGTDVKSVRARPSLDRGLPVAARARVRGRGAARSARASGTSRRATACSAATRRRAGSAGRAARGRESLCEDLEYLLGGFAEQVLVPERIVGENLHRVPDGLDLRVAALAEPLGCVVHALDRVDVAEGDRAACSAPARSG